MATTTNDIDSLFNDSDDDDLVENTISDKVTKESFLALVEAASNGGDFIKIINLLPNSSQRYGHSLTMNAIIKIISRDATFKDRCTGFFSTKIKSGKETKVVSTYNNLNQSNKELLQGMIREVTPSNGPWFEIINLLKLCDEAFNESASSISRIGLPTNRIACVAHMLCDERFLACVIPLTVTTEAAGRPGELDHMKATGKTKSDAVYSDIYQSYKSWLPDYKNPFVDGLFKEDLAGIKPHLAVFKDAAAIRSLVKSTVQKVETILKNHQQSGHHSSGDERLLEIRNSFLSPKGKNVDMGIFYAFLMLEDKDLKFASRSLEDGVGASAGFGTVGGGTAVVLNKKRDASEAALSQIDLLTRRLSENSDRLTNTTEKAMVRLFSPSPTFTDVSSSVNETASYVAAKEVKVVVERKLLCLKEQIEYQKYVLMSECFNAEEKVAAKQELAALMKELKELTK
jgi:hypothetical protein